MNNLYQESFLLRILGMLEFYCSLAIHSPAALAMIKHLSNPEKLSSLIRLLTFGTPKMKVIVLKIFTSLVRMEIPHEIFDKSVSVCMKLRTKDDDLQHKRFKMIMETKTIFNLD